MHTVDSASTLGSRPASPLPPSDAFPSDLSSVDRIPTSVLICASNLAFDNEYYQMIRTVSALITFDDNKLLDPWGKAYRTREPVLAVALRLHWLGYGPQLQLSTQARLARVYAHAACPVERILAHCRVNKDWRMAINPRCKDLSVDVYRPLHVLTLIARADLGVTGNDIGERVPTAA